MRWDGIEMKWDFKVWNMGNKYISGISYELFKHLSNDTSKYLKEIVMLYFAFSHIPSEWKEVTIYPIPKPQEWHYYLKNT